MRSSRKFQISDHSAILTPEARGLDTLMSGLQRGHSIIAHQSRNIPISTRPAEEQQLYCETSGTSGGAKTIRRRPDTWIRSFEINRHRFDLNTGDTYATLGHIGHSLSLYGIMEGFHIGADILLLAGQSPKGQISGLIEHRASTLYATPAQLHLLIAGAKAANAGHLPAMRRIFSGGGKLEPDLRHALERLFPGAAIHEFFGASETSFITITDTGTPEGSVGLPYPDVSIEIRGDLATGATRTGEIWVRSPYLFEGYEGTGSPDTRWDGDYLSIGEIGYRDSMGHLFLKGRKSRMVTIADMNVFPEEVEKLLAALPQVRRCVALTQLDEKRGHRMACVIEGEHWEGLEALMRQKCREELGAQTMPYRFLFLDAVPMLAAGKPDIQALTRLMEASPDA